MAEIFVVSPTDSHTDKQINQRQLNTALRTREVGSSEKIRLKKTTHKKFSKRYKYTKDYISSIGKTESMITNITLQGIQISGSEVRSYICQIQSWLTVFHRTTLIPVKNVTNKIHYCTASF